MENKSVAKDNKKEQRIIVDYTLIMSALSWSDPLSKYINIDTNKTTKTDETDEL